MSARHRGQAGLSIVEVLITILVITTGALATMGTFTKFSEAARKAQRRAVLVSMAQREIEVLRAVPYAQLGLSGSPPSAAASEAPLTGSASSEPLATGGAVSPGGDSFSAQGARGRLYRYVTWTAQSCPAINAKVKTQVGAALGIDVSTALGDLCPGTTSTKRITVVLVPDEGSGVSGRPVRLSSVVVDPTSSTPAAAGYAGLQLQQAVASVAGSSGGSGSTVPSLTTQVFSLYDTRCDASSREIPVSHPTHETARSGTTCSGGGARPNLMGLTPIPGALTDPVRDFSDDLVRPAEGGLLIMRDDRAGSCTDATSLAYTDAESAVRRRSIHSWATTGSATAFETPVSSGRGTVTLWTSTATGSDAPGRLCVVVRRESSGAILGSSDYTLSAWPGEATQLTMAFDVTGAALSAGERLLLTVRVPGDSGSDLRVLYDHPAYASNMTVTTVVGKEFH